MFVPTIKYRKVNAEKDGTVLVDNSTALLDAKQHCSNGEIPSLFKSQGTSTDSSTISQSSNHLTASSSISQPKETTAVITQGFTLEEKDDAMIIVDPSDAERILITLSDGKTQYTADRYCPHAGADLSYLGQVDEDEYPPEIGPILLCTLHYWEYALKKAGRGANGVATINACPFSAADGGDSDDGVTCHVQNKLDW